MNSIQECICFFLLSVCNRYSLNRHVNSALSVFGIVNFTIIGE
ncbi:hypothetical protein XELAEV_18003529mg [Xenopus laevis]|uniref:Uncharacterized protein n=1 Tax=Xenopus laevis TaxID=8355 RepID=A0A974GYH7_XENLA|nr:hypothetical protein XELAEV_18003529mg [Xenopus laevis]